MNNLIKIKGVSSKYDITARTLRYYEDMKLLYNKAKKIETQLISTNYIRILGFKAVTCGDQPWDEMSNNAF